MSRYIGNDSSQYPYASVAYIEALFPDGSLVSGSGALVGRNDILTAAHVIYNPQWGGSAESVSIYLGRDGAYQPYGQVDGARLNYFELDVEQDGFLTQAESENDLALIGLDQAVGDDLGWFNLGSYSVGEIYHVTGYPSAYRDSSGPRLVEDVGYATEDANFDLIEMDGLDVSPGSSGGPLWYGSSSSPILVGTVSTRSWAVSLEAHEETLQRWISGNDHLIPVLDPGRALVDGLFLQLDDEGWLVPAGLGDDILATDQFITFPDVEQVIDPILRLYTGMLGRQPDRDGVEYWIEQVNAGNSLRELTSFFVASAEFQSLISQWGGGFDGAIHALYQNVLGRVADQQGLSYWQETLQSGRADLVDVAYAFTQSDEYVAATESLVQGAKLLLWGPNLAGLDVAEAGFDVAAFASEQFLAETIVRLYTGVLDRVPDVAGFEYWLQQGEDTSPLPLIADGFLGSQEFRSSPFVSSDEQLVDYLYQQVLGRSGDASGQSYWLGELVSGALEPWQLVLAFVNSAEYQSATDDLVDSFLLEHYDGGLVGVPVDLETYLLG